jgi:beta-aspartyl-peptidase (threonine type)
MKRHLIFSLFIWAFMIQCHEPTKPETMPTTTGQTAIAIHGGAGNLKKLNLTPEQEEAYKATLAEALKAGNDILQNNGSAIEAVEAAIRVMEDSPLFNAGKGAVFNHEGINELDAAIMNGKDLSCGAMAGVRHLKNPISGAKKVMEDSDFILLSGIGAEEFAKNRGLEMVDSAYYFTDLRWQQLLEAREEDSVKLDHSTVKGSSQWNNLLNEEKFGTVGCVALDKNGNIAAGTSTGGLTNKRYGRIGDSPIIGAGTYADNQTCAVSCTGKGEDFIRLNVAHDIASMIRYKQSTIKDAVHEIIQVKLKGIKGRGGCIAINTNGEIAMEYTTTGMYRGSIDTSGQQVIAIY